MKKVIRWPGFVAFIAIMLAVTLFFTLFLDNLVRLGLTSVLTRMNHAEVNIEQVELHWSPFTVQVQGLAMTDPERPTHNRFVAETLQAQVRLLELFIGKVHIDDLTVEGIAVGTERLKVGKVAADEEATEAEPVPLRERLAEYNIELPTAESFLAGADIQTPGLLAETEQAFKERRDDFELARQELPSKDVLENYKARLEAIIDSKPKKARELLAAREALKEVKADMRVDKERVETFIQVSEGIVSATEQDIAALRASYQADIEKAKTLFQLDPDSLTALSGILFGEKVEQWAHYGLVAMDVLAPLLKSAQSESEEQKHSRWTGRYIDFDTQSSPSFWVKNAQLSMKLEQLELALSMHDVTWQHERINTATTYQLLAESAGNWDTFNFNGELFINNQGQVNGEQTWQLDGAQLDNLELSGSSALLVELRQALVNSRGTLTLAGGQFDGNSEFHFTQSNFQVEGEATVAPYIGDALSSIHAFNLDLGIRGQLAKPQFSLHSDLDRQIGAQLNARLQSEADARLQQVRQSLTEQSDGVLAQLGPWLEQAQALHAEGKSMEETFTELLEKELESLIESERDRFLERLKRKNGD